jgi:hypothetical protein
MNLEELVNEINTVDDNQLKVLFPKGYKQWKFYEEYYK